MVDFIYLCKTPGPHRVPSNAVIFTPLSFFFFLAYAVNPFFFGHPPLILLMLKELKGCNGDFHL